MQERSALDGHETAPVGTTVTSLEPVPGVGTWEVVDHGGCAGSGRLKALTTGDPAPLCPVCDQKVTLRLARLAPAVGG